MSGLPRALAAWAEALEIFGSVVHEGIGAWLTPLRSVLGPMTVPASADMGDPDGYAGISRRGGYERLLLSEWAMALELPDEFLRRAVMGEHMFTAPAYRAPHGASTSVVLLDSGPQQMGKPRLAHLAALLVLEERAKAHDAVFGFGTLQYPEAALRSLSRASVTKWATQTSWEPARAGLAAWSEQLAPEPPTDLWLIGPPELAATSTSLSANVLTVEAFGSELRLAVHRRGHSGTTLSLPLPPDETCVHVLRNPLGPQRRAATETPGVGGNHRARLSFDGRRLFLPGPDASALALHVPNSSAETPGRPKRVTAMEDSRILAIDMGPRRLIALSVTREGQLAVRGAGLGDNPSAGSNSVGQVLPTVQDAPPSLLNQEPGTLCTLLVSDGTRRRFRAWIWDAEQQLWELTIAANEHGVPTEVAFTCLDRACRQLHRLSRLTIAWISASTGRVEMSGSDLDISSIAEGYERAVFGLDHRRDPMVAWPSGSVMATTRHTPGLAMATPTGRLFGLRTERSTTKSSAVIFVRDDREVVVRTAASTDQLLFTATAPIEHIEFSPTADRIYWHTTSGDRGIYCFRRSEVVLRLTAVGDPPTTADATKETA